ncbi:tyrosine-protein phosphatase non-receptor type substrate 1-like [Latimeria chalumnae]|uniref:tyrosine-protein phosphatase non-receptor type substrate 1-like n=1 Tax=Latimeria chalumnae TaxID=7897 RepID=UPI00313E1BD6
MLLFLNSLFNFFFFLFTFSLSFLVYSFIIFFLFFLSICALSSPPLSSRLPHSLTSFLSLPPLASSPPPVLPLSACFLLPHSPPPSPSPFLPPSLSVAKCSGLNVSQSPPSQSALKGETVRLQCLFSVTRLSLSPSARLSVTWLKENPNGTTSVLPTGDPAGRLSLAHSRTFHLLGDASLVIANVTVEDTGIYYCQLRIWQAGVANGTGTYLAVRSPPTVPEVFLLTNENSEGRALVCKSSDFHPMEINLSWYRGGVSFSSGDNRKKWNLETNVVEVFNLLPLTPEQDNPGSEYTCVIHHVSLLQPLTKSFIVSLLGIQECHRYIVGWLNGIKLIVLAFIFLLHSLHALFQLKKRLL